MMNPILALSLWLLPIAGNIYLDRNGRKPNQEGPSYLLTNIIRGMLLILHSALFIPGYWMGTDFANWVWLHLWAPVFIFDITSFWVLFDLGLNLVRGNPPLYYDQKEMDSGWVDKFFKWTGPKFHLVCKILALILMIISATLIIMRWNYQY